MISFSCSGRPGSPTETKSEKSSTSAMTSLSGGAQMSAVLGSKLSGTYTAKQARSPEAFVSLQLEKVSICDEE